MELVNFGVPADAEGSFFLAIEETVVSSNLLYLIGFLTKVGLFFKA